MARCIYLEVLEDVIKAPPTKLLVEATEIVNQHYSHRTVNQPHYVQLFTEKQPVCVCVSWLAFTIAVCGRTIQGVTRFEQWKERLTSRTLFGEFGMEWSMADIIMDRRLKRLGHLGQMS